MASNLLKAIGFRPKDDEEKNGLGNVLSKIKVPDIKVNIPAPITNTVKAIASIPKSIGSWLKLDQPVGITKSLPQPVQTVVNPAVKTARAGLEVLNLPSYMLGGAIKAGREFEQGNYQAPSTGIKLTQISGTNKGRQTDVGEIIHPLFPGIVRGVTQKQALMEEVPKTAGLDPNSFPGLVVGLTAEIAAPGPGGEKKTAEKLLNKVDDAVKISKAEELVTFLKNAFKVKPVDLSTGSDIVNVDLTKALDTISNLNIEKTLLSKFKKGTPLIGDGFTLQAKPKTNELLINIGKNFNDVLPEVSKKAEKVIETVKAAAAKGKVNLGNIVNKTDEIVEKAGDIATDLGQEIKAIPGKISGEKIKITGKEIRDFLKKNKTLPDLAENILPAGDIPIRLPSATEELRKFGPEFGQFLQDARTAAFKADTEGFIDKALDAATANDELAQQFKTALKELDKNPLQNIWQQGVETVKRIANDKLSPLTDFWQNLFKYKVSDLPLDQELQGIERAKIAFESKTSLLYQQAKQEAEKILGRVMSGEETGALLRGDFQKELELSKKGVTGIKLGEDILPKVDELGTAFNKVHEEIAANVLMYEKELDQAVQNGFITLEKAKQMRLVQPEQFATNIKKYVRTFYDKAAQELPDTNLDMDIANDVAISFSSAKKKLSDQEWGTAYLQALNSKMQATVSKASKIPQDLIDKVNAGDTSAIAELGRRVKELRGYVTEGERSVGRTINYLTNQWTDIKTLNLIGDRPDLFSNTFVEGFSKIPEDKRFGPLAGKFIRSDIAKSFEKEFSYDKLVSDIPGIISWYGAIWRASRTVLNVPVWGTNFMSGLLGMQTLAGNSPFNPGNWKYFKQAAKEFPEFLRTGKVLSPKLQEFLSLGGRQSTFVDSVVLQGIGEAFENVKTADTLADKLYNIAVKGSDKLEDIGKNFGSLDAFNKYATFLNKTDKGYSAVEAMQIADKYHLNYDLAPKFVQFFKNTPVLDTIVPFLSFPVMYGRMFVNTAAEKPWRLIPFFLAPRAWNMQWNLRHPDLADKAEEQKPSYLKGNPFVITLGQEDDGSFKYVDMAKFFGVPTSEEGGIRFFTGPFSNLGGPFSAIADVVRGTNSFGQPLNTPYTETSTQHLISGATPIPPIVNQLADIVKTALGAPARGKIRDLSDEIFRAVGVSVLTGAPNQLEKNINALTSDFNEWRSYAKTIMDNPKASQAAKEDVANQLIEKRNRYVTEVKSYLQNNTDTKPENLDITSQGIVNGILGNFANIVSGYQTPAPITTPSPTTTPAGKIDLSTLTGKSGKGIKLKNSVSKAPAPNKIKLKALAKKKSSSIQSIKPLTPLRLSGPTLSQPSKGISLSKVRSIKAPAVPTLS